MYPITQSLLVSIYPREKRGQALALLAMITVLGMDLPDQRAVGHLRRAGGGQPAEGSPGADRETEDGLRRPDHPGDRRRCATAGARPGQ
ncbi:hypothetical protein G6F60_014973 [Rhizopus arrhizus]|nr:hypothetical protein G6F60_014973 [Rhizopus arrhizus]